MITKILVEDSTDGLELCRIINRIYGREDILVDTFGGIINISNTIESIRHESGQVVIVYDDIVENPLVMDNIVMARRLVRKYKLSDRCTFIKIISFELEVLLLPGIQAFLNQESYNKYVSNIVRMYKENESSAHITLYTKEQEVYSEMYDKIKREKLKKRIYASMSEERLDQSITIESLAKELIKEVFRNQPIDKPMTACWKTPCCWRTRRCKTEMIDTYKIESAQQENNDPYVKANILISNTSYKKLAELLADGKEILQYNVADFFVDNRLESGDM